MDNGHSFGSMLRYAVLAFLGKMGMTQRSATQCLPRYAVHDLLVCLQMCSTSSRYAVPALLGCLQMRTTFSCNTGGEPMHTHWCRLFWAVCKCVPPFHATLEVNLCTRIFKLYHIDTAWKKTTVCFSMNGKGVIGMVLTQGSVAVCLEQIEGYDIYGQ